MTGSRPTSPASSCFHHEQAGVGLWWNSTRRTQSSRRRAARAEIGANIRGFAIRNIADLLVDESGKKQLDSVTAWSQAAAQRRSA